MFDTQLDDLLEQIDMVTNRLAAINSGEAEPESPRHTNRLRNELAQLNAQVARRYASLYVSPPRRTSLSDTWYIQALLFSVVVTMAVIVIGVAVHALFQSFAASLGSMARPVP